VRLSVTRGEWVWFMTGEKMVWEKERGGKNLHQGRGGSITSGWVGTRSSPSQRPMSRQSLNIHLGGKKRGKDRSYEKRENQRGPCLGQNNRPAEMQGGEPGVVTENSRKTVSPVTIIERRDGPSTRGGKTSGA